MFDGRDETASYSKKIDNALENKPDKSCFCGLLCARTSGGEKCMQSFAHFSGSALHTGQGRT